MNFEFIQKGRWAKGIFIYAAILLIPFSFLIEITYPDLTLKAKIGLSDLAIMGGTIVLGISWVINRSYCKIKLPDKIIHLFIACFFISVINANSLVDFIKEFLQVILGFYLMYMLLLNTITSRKEVDRLINTLVVSAITLILIAIYQYSFARLHPYFVRSLFANRNLHSIFVAGTLPFVFVKIFHTKSKILKLIYILVLELAFFSTLSFGHLIASVLAIALMLLFISKKYLISYAVIITINFIILIYVMPCTSAKEFKKFASVYEMGNIKNSIRQGWLYNDLSNHSKLLSTEVQGISVQISNDAFIPLKITKREKFDFSEYVLNNKNIIKQYYAEWQASLNLLENNTFTGCGLGNYQNEIGSHYLDLPKNNTSEPNFINGYSVIWSTTGILGFCCFMALIILSSHRILKRITHRNKKDKWSVACMGSLIALSISNLFTPVLVSQVIILFSFVIFLNLQYFSTNNE